MPYPIVSRRFHHVTVCDPPLADLKQPTSHDIYSAARNTNSSYIHGPFRVSYGRRRGHFDLRFFLPTHFHRLVYQCHACGFDDVVETEGAENDADDDYGDGGVAVHGELSMELGVLLSVE